MINVSPRCVDNALIRVRRIARGSGGGLVNTRDLCCGRLRGAGYNDVGTWHGSELACCNGLARLPVHVAVP